MSNENSRVSLLGDLSFTQVIVGAMAAATSFAFSQRIGVLGSVIGAAVGSITATIASQVYRSVIDRSLAGIRDLEGNDARPAQEPAPRRRSFAPAIIALLVGLGALGIYMTGVDFLTGGTGIGTQAPIIEYVTVPAAPAGAEDASVTEAVEEDTGTADGAPSESDDAAQAVETLPVEEPAGESPADGSAEPSPDQGTPSDEPVETADSEQL